MSQLINRIIDSNVFGSANLDKRFCSVEKGEVVSEEVRDWFKWRGISYYHEEEKGILYLQFSSSRCVAMEEGFEGVKLGFDELLEDLEFGDLQGLLFMFSVSFSTLILILILIHLWYFLFIFTPQYSDC